jgi:hypothetical protein
MNILKSPVGIRLVLPDIGVFGYLSCTVGLPTAKIKNTNGCLIRIPTAYSSQPDGLTIVCLLRRHVE